MPVVGAQIYCHFCSSEAVGDFPFITLRVQRGLWWPVGGQWVVGGALLFCPPVFNAFFKTCTHKIPFFLLVLR